MRFAHVEALRTTVLVENDHWGGLISTSPDPNRPEMWGMNRKTHLSPKEESPKAEVAHILESLFQKPLGGAEGWQRCGHLHFPPNRIPLSAESQQQEPCLALPVTHRKTVVLH